MSLSRCLKPPPLCSARITGRHSSYGWLRLPRTTARVLAFTLVRGCPLPADRCADLPGYRVFSMSGSTRPRTPGSIRAARHGATPIVAYRRDKTVGTHQPKFSGLNTFRVGFTRYLCTSPAFVPTHRRACYQSRRKARYWARGARLPRRDFHPLEHAALPGRTVPDFPRLACEALAAEQRIAYLGHQDTATTESGCAAPCTSCSTTPGNVNAYGGRRGAGR